MRRRGFAIEGFFLFFVHLYYTPFQNAQNRKFLFFKAKRTAVFEDILVTFFAVYRLFPDFEFAVFAVEFVLDGNFRNAVFFFALDLVLALAVAVSEFEFELVLRAAVLSFGIEPE